MSDLRIYFRKKLGEEKRNNKNNCIRINHIKVKKK